MRAVLRSERARLTALYGSLLLLAGGGLIALINILLRNGLYTRISGAVATTKVLLPDSQATVVPGHQLPVPAEKIGPGVTPTPEQLATWKATQELTNRVEQATLHELLIVSLVALVVFAMLSIWLAWWMAGRVLRPVSVITETARRLSGANLHERIGLKAPPGELKRLADTFDGMLDRMEDLVGAQRRFAANAAHELRTPLAVQRAAAEIGLAGDPPPEKVARIRAKLIDVADSSRHLVESLLLLAVSEEGLEVAEPVDLSALAASELAAVELAAAEGTAPQDLAVVRDLVPLTVTGDRTLLGHLVRNLLANAVRHNRAGGRLEVETSADGVLTVSNTGPVIDPEDVPRLLEPFRRRAERQHTAGEGAGLGLSIVASIARAHGAELTARANPRPGGGLTVRVWFPEDGAVRETPGSPTG
ncbi:MULTISPECIES: ATP-binding protein [unclassified Streptomyces]|uniref:sensor histidine kinase n=1 Tax=unclassified Streptomyces TaxID=2593676 RepID=UPI000DC798BE|nr:MULTISPECIES: ATP-binding protein [unclassified Streptomyces]AWZ08288.1 two-component sensor histidine kinase [Streptomyces sp. ICC4]AWZ16113.1 two-component sensor histidine kinase [Streptomyces sp. ICC1]